MQNKTSYGQTLLRERLQWFIKGTPIENYRGAWLCGMELDFFYIEHGLAFEFQGDQHFMPVYGEEALRSQQSRDASKRRLCRQMGIVLVKVEAWELPKLKLKTKIFAAMNSYRKTADRTARRAWVKSVFVDKHRYHNRPCRRDYSKQEAKDYQFVIGATFNGITAIPKKFVHKRAAAMERFKAAQK